MASRVFWIQELALEILKYADILSIVNVGHSNKQGQLYMRRVLADSIGDMLRPYFAEYDERQEFFKMLEDTGGVITGSCALKILLPYERRNTTTPNLNIVVPIDKSSPAVAFMKTRGYAAKELSVTYNRVNLVQRCDVLVNHTSGAVVIVTESRKSTVLNVILHGENTALMNIITARNIYSFYPELTAKGEATSGFITATPRDIAKAKKWGINLQRPLYREDQEGDCGLECPIKFRKIQGMEGIGFVCWNEEGSERQDISTQRMGWSLGPLCINTHCVLAREDRRLCMEE